MGKVDPKLLEMAEVFHIPRAARLKYIILPAKLPRLARLLMNRQRRNRRESANDNPA